MAQTALRRGSQEEGNSEYFTGCPIGGGFMWFGLLDKIPANCRVCENQTLAIADFAKLNENLGGAWGTSGGNLNIPDLRGKFPRGVDGGAANDPDRAGRTNPNAGGNTGDAVGSTQNDAMQNITGSISLPPAMSPAPTGAFSQGNLNSTGDVLRGSNNGRAYNFNSSSSSGVRTSTESRPKNVNVYFVIRVN
jgi:microcystin-dependent protein